MLNSDDQIGARAKLEHTGDPVGSHGKTPISLANFLKSAERKGRLKKKERLRIVEQALLLLTMNYVHLPLKRAMHAVDPIQQLKLLQFRLLEARESQLPNQMQFHQRMMEIFGSNRDLHTLYMLPAPFRDHVAYLPFLIEQYFTRTKSGARIDKYTVSRIARSYYNSIPNPGPEILAFEPGVDVLFWNGVPIKRAIEINGAAQAGSNIDARFARGLDNLTIRPLESSLPPDEHWINLTFRAKNGKILTLNQEWLVHETGESNSVVSSKTTTRKRAAIDIKKYRINQVRQTLFTTRSIRVHSSLQNVLYAQTRNIDGRDFGYIRLFNFDVADPDRFVTDFARIITAEKFPQEGLIIDVRGNGGGKIRAGERLLQLFTPRKIEPELFEFLNTPLNLEICRYAPPFWELAKWADSIAESVVTGATYSNGFPLNSPESCNDIGQKYYGPVILVTDALSYSTTDMFAAGFQDNEVGEVLGTSDNTGAGGANVWWYEDLMHAAQNSPSSPFKPLPKGADILIAVRRSIRVGKHAGRPLEELGIVPDHRHYITKRDVMASNEDLVERAARILMNKPVYRLSVKPYARSGVHGLNISASSKVGTTHRDKRISRIDVYLGGRPYKSIDAKRGAIDVEVSIDRPRSISILLEARDELNRLVAMWRRD
jgi:C-terminal processing protease CtpA/Prc